MSTIITRTIANSEIRRYLNNVDRAKSKLLEISDPASREYFNSEEISFIFERGEIDALLSLNTEADCIRVYYGSHEDGKPTLIMFAGKIKRTATTVDSNNLLYSDMLAAAEWPNGKPRKITAKSINDFDILDDNE